jgi:putative transposase
LVDIYNNRPHSSLPKVIDPQTGKRRHQTPNEAWQAGLDEGWAPTLVTTSEAEDLFRPYVYATVLRGEIRLFNNLYFSHELTEWHGEKVRVGYDLHDGSRVWVRKPARACAR